MFSVVIPLYNKHDTVKRAIDSVLNQSLPPDEIIVVNDGSTDGSDKLVCAQFGQRVRLVDQTNQGVSVARNIGLKQATCRYVAFLDSDDEWKPDFLARLSAMINVYPDAGMYGSGFFSFNNGVEIERYAVSPKDLKNSEDVFGRVDFFSALSKRHVLCSSSIAVDREKALMVGGFPEGVAICEDMEFWILMALENDVVLTPECLAVYHTDASDKAKNFWQHEYKKEFPVLHFHHFLVEQYKHHAATNSSFAQYCRHHLEIALLQRLYHRRFDSASRFCSELRLEDYGLGWRIGCLRWITQKFG